MGVYIKGMEMPEDNSVAVMIFPDGRVGIIPYAQLLTIELIEGTQVIPVPKHGRMGDLDRLAKEVKDMAKEFPTDSIGAERYRLLAEFIKTAPTIIPAEEEK